MEEQAKRLMKFEDHGITDIVHPFYNTAYMRTTREKLREVAQYLKDEGFVHCTTITAVDYPDNYEMVYHLRDMGFSINLKVAIPKEDPKVPSIADIILGANLFEREANDVMGIFPEGHPNPARLILDYDWPEGLYPLRKSETLESIKEKADAAMEENQ
jgi:NADH:ubiquinone oxidoreductase subunit C